MDFVSSLKARNRLLKILYHRTNQETLSQEELMVIVICCMPNLWQQEFELYKVSNTDQSICLVVTCYFESQQSFKDSHKHIHKHGLYHNGVNFLYKIIFIYLKVIMWCTEKPSVTDVNLLFIAEGNQHVMHQENKHISRKFVQDNFTLSGCGSRAHDTCNSNCSQPCMQLWNNSPT